VPYTFVVLDEGSVGQDGEVASDAASASRARRVSGVRLAGGPAPRSNLPGPFAEPLCEAFPAKVHFPQAGVHFGIRMRVDCLLLRASTTLKSGTRTPLPPAPLATDSRLTCLNLLPHDAQHHCVFPITHPNALSSSPSALTCTLPPVCCAFSGEGGRDPPRAAGEDERSPAERVGEAARGAEWYKGRPGRANGVDVEGAARRGEAGV